MNRQEKRALLLANLIDADPEKRKDAARRMGRRGARERVPPLIEALSDSEYKVRRNAARSLGVIGDARAVEPLSQALRDETASVRKTAAAALGQIRDPFAVEALCRALTDRKQTVRENALYALTEIGASAICGLAQTIASGMPKAQDAARHALVTLYERDKQLTTTTILSEPKLTPVERFQTLEAIKQARPAGLLSRFSAWIGNVPQFCSETVEHHRAYGTADSAECKGAESVLQMLTLVRAGQRSTGTERTELLRGSSSSNTPQRSEELLRGSDCPRESSPRKSQMSLWKWLFPRKS